MTIEYRQNFVETLGFGPDRFQIEAIEAVDLHKNVLVSAPTGSGKTLVANYAVGRALQRGEKAFYTTPLKALSNQKYLELCQKFGAHQVGLLTGDTSINRTAPIVVMTTEVLRNMLLTDSDSLRNLGLVVLDEVHFLQDRYRGGVWEEVIILTPSAVRFVSLSATIGNAAFLGSWLSDVRGDTVVVVETERPISIHHHFSLVRRGQTQAEIEDLIDEGNVSESARRVDNTMRNTRKFRPGRQWYGPKSSAPPPPFRSPRRTEILQVLEREDMLPAIVFIFSRSACDDAASQVRRDGLIFTSPEQREEIESIVQERLVNFSEDDLKALEYHDFFENIRRGIAAHHAGLIPAFREIVEIAFARNLLGVVFATETLALGINMPARTVVLERFSKYSDDGRQFLTSGEYSQLTGRAGRRGLDDEGHAVVCFNPEVSFHDVGRVALAPPSDLRSSFRPTYNFTANMVNHFELETAMEVVNKSLAQFESLHRPTQSKRPLVEQMKARHKVLMDLGYADGWSLTESGQFLRSIYHECDLLVAESIQQGVFEDLEPAAFAGLISAFVYEGKRAGRAPVTAKNVPVKNRRNVPDHVGSDRRASLRERNLHVQAIFQAIRETEDQYVVPHFREPDHRFSVVVTAWARGANLSTVLDLADTELGLTSPGDFVRNAKQVADLCEQIARLTHLGEISSVAMDARDCVLRSVVAGDSTMHQIPG